MKIFPAIDLYDGMAVRLVHGEYSRMTICSNVPVEKAMEFRLAGAEYLHLVDLQGARDGVSKNFEVATQIARVPGLKVELGGGIRDEETIKRALDAGFYRVILGTAAMEDQEFLAKMVSKYGEQIVVGVDVRSGFVAVRGWTQISKVECFDFVQNLQDMGVKTILCTDIASDGAMKGTNVDLFKRLSDRFDLDIIASGGITTMDDVRALKDAGLTAATIGRALYAGKIDLKEAIEVAK